MNDSRRSIRQAGQKLDVIVHGGMHKTGTTAVQAWMMQNRAVLAEQGIAVLTPQLLPFLWRGDAQALTQDLRGLLEQARAAGVTRVLISHEGISHMQPDRLLAFRRALDGHPTQFLLAVRHWNGFLPSRWKQNCRRADTQPFQQMLRDMLVEGSTHGNLRFDHLVSRLLAARFDRLSVLSYDVARGSGGIVKAVLDAAGIDAAVTAAQADRIENESLGIYQADMLRLFNGMRSVQQGLPRDPLHFSVDPARGAPRAHYFDHDAGLVVNVLARVFPEFSARVAARETTVLRGSVFAPFERALMQVARPHIFNPAADGSLFGPVPDVALHTSPLTVDDFSAVEMRALLIAVADAQAFGRSGAACIGPVVVPAPDAAFAVSLSGRAG